MGLILGIGIFLRSPRSRGNISPPGITAPLNLSYADKVSSPPGITFSWQAPLHWGASGPATTNRYQIDYVQSTDPNNATFLSATPNIPLATYVDVLTYDVTDPPISGYISFRVRAINANGDISGWRTTPVLDYDTATAYTQPSQDRRFGPRFGPRFG